MFPAKRQIELNSVTDELRQVQGITVVEEDDFDSTSINVFLSLKVDKFSYRGPTYPFAFVRRISDVKKAINKAVAKAGKGFNFLHWPQLQYEYDNGEKIKVGYDCNYVKIEVFV